MTRRAAYPRAKYPRKVGSYAGLAKSGGGYFWDEVLEYRVWCHPERGAPDPYDGNDYFHAFPDHPSARRFSQRTPGAETPLVLIRQRQYIDEPNPGEYHVIRELRVTEWRPEWLRGAKRNARSMARFLADGGARHRARHKRP